MTEKRFFPDYDQFDFEYQNKGYCKPSNDGIVDQDLNNEALTVSEVDTNGNIKKFVDRQPPKRHGSFSL